VHRHETRDDAPAGFTFRATAEEDGEGREEGRYAKDEGELRGVPT
jgi:hypothetical protein